MTERDDLDRSEIEAVLETRRELGSVYEPALVDSFADKIEVAIAARVDAQVSRRQGEQRADESRGHRQMVLGIVSLGTGIPITAIAGGVAQTSGVMIAWIGIAVVNGAHAWQGRHKR
ncbi:MAG: hypothetical protein M3393_09465 [Actinomycetota bacterium]|nr:hypothetical protein [Actinomycetota bacterium]